MIIIEMMKTHDISVDWLFTIAKLRNKEGLMFFEPLNTEVNGVDVSELNPKCFIIDGVKFIYDDDLDTEIIIYAVDEVITFTRVDGIQLNINTNQIKGFPFKHEQFNKCISKVEKPQDGYILVD